MEADGANQAPDPMRSNYHKDQQDLAREAGEMSKWSWCLLETVSPTLAVISSRAFYWKYRGWEKMHAGACGTYFVLIWLSYWVPRFFD